MCASMIVPMPRCGQPVSCCSDTNSSSDDRPSITSGITIGAELIRLRTPRPGKRPKRDSAMPLAVPSATAAVAATAAISRLRPSASRICWLRNSSPYQRSENPPQTVASREALNEYTITETIGR